MMGEMQGIRDVLEECLTSSGRYAEPAVISSSEQSTLVLCFESAATDHSTGGRVFASILADERPDHLVPCVFAHTPFDDKSADHLVSDEVPEIPGDAQELAVQVIPEPVEVG
jgi:hypothetical protein